MLVHRPHNFGHDIFLRRGWRNDTPYGDVSFVTMLVKFTSPKEMMPARLANLSMVGAITRPHDPARFGPRAI